jgi:hypothetical protein
MSYIRADSPKEQQYFDFLEDLRQSGETNMFGASPYLQAAFSLTKDEATQICSRWMKFHSDPSRILEGPSTDKKVKTRFVTRAEVSIKKRKA